MQDGERASLCERHGLFRRDRQGRRGGGVALCVRERFDFTALAVRDDVVESLWVRIRGMENKEDVSVGAYYPSPSQDESTDELAYGQLGETSGFLILVLSFFLFLSFCPLHACLLRLFCLA